MNQTVRVIVLNTDDQVAADLRAVLLGVDGVKIVAELDEPALLGQALEQFSAEVLLIHLDPAPAAIMDAVAPLIERYKERVAAIAMTEDRDAELVMRAMRAGMREFLWKPFPPEQLGEILKRVGGESCPVSRRAGRLVAVMGASGGVGSTSVAINTAAELSALEGWTDSHGQAAKPRVVVADMDFRFGQVAMQLDAQPSFTIAELVDTPEQLDEGMIERAVFKHTSGLHLLARPSDFGQAENISAGQCAAVLAGLQDHYDFVVVDFPARFDSTARAVFDMADAFVIVLNLMVPSVRNTDRMLHELARSGYAMERTRLACNRVSRDNGYLEQSDVETTLKRKMDFVLPDEWKISSAAINMGMPLLAHAPRSKLRMAYRKIALVLGGIENQPTDLSESGESRKGLFKFFAGSTS